MNIGIDFEDIVDVGPILLELNERLFNKKNMDQGDYDSLLSLVYESIIITKQEPQRNIKQKIISMHKSNPIYIILKRGQESGFRVKEFLEKNSIPFDKLLCTNNQPLKKILKKHNITIRKL